MLRRFDSHWQLGPGTDPVMQFRMTICKTETAGAAMIRRRQVRPEGYVEGGLRRLSFETALRKADRFALSGMSPFFRWRGNVSSRLRLGVITS